MSRALRHGHLRMRVGAQWMRVAAVLAPRELSITPLEVSISDGRAVSNQQIALSDISAIRMEDREPCCFRMRVRDPSLGEDAEDMWPELAFAAASDEDCLEWMRALLLAKQFASRIVCTDGAENAAFLRFASSDSEDDGDEEEEEEMMEAEDVGGATQDAMLPVPAPVVAATMDSICAIPVDQQPHLQVHVSVTHPDGRMIGVSLALSVLARRGRTVRHLKLAALRRLRHQVSEVSDTDARAEPDAAAIATTTSMYWFQTFLAHDPEYFVLRVDSTGTWLAEEDQAVVTVVPETLQQSIIQASLVPLHTMPSPSMCVTISTTKDRASDLSRRSFTIYVIVVTFNEMRWEVARRYREFDRLQQQLKLKYDPQGIELPKLPGKHRLVPHQKGFVVKRRQQLEQYLHLLLQHAVVSQDVLVLAFLGVISTARDQLWLKHPDKDVIHITALPTSLEYGDIVLFSTRYVPSVLQRKVTRAQYDHVGMVVPNDPHDLDHPQSLRLLEATSEGIQIYALQLRLMAYAREVSSRIVVRHITAKRTPDLSARLSAFAAHVEGSAFSILGVLLGHSESVRLQSPSSTARSEEDASFHGDTPRTPSLQSLSVSSSEDGESSSNCSSSASASSSTSSHTRRRSSRIQPTNRKFFCSSLAATALKELGWLQTTRSSNYFWPGSFANNGEIEQWLASDISIGPETLVDCHIAEIGLAQPVPRSPPMTID